MPRICHKDTPRPRALVEHGEPVLVVIIPYEGLFCKAKSAEARSGAPGISLTDRRTYPYGYILLGPVGPAQCGRGGWPDNTGSQINGSINIRRAVRSASHA